MNQSDKDKIRAFRQWVTYRTNLQQPVAEDLASWQQVTAEQFDDYIQSSAHLNYLGGGTLTTTSSSGSKQFYKDPLEDRKKQVKKDQSVFPTLKDAKDWDRFKNSMLIHAAAQNVENVLNILFPTPGQDAGGGTPLMTPEEEHH